MSSADDRNKSADYVPEEDSTEMEVVNATADVDDEDEDGPVDSFDTEDEDDAEAEAEKAAIARRERERLRLQDKVKRDNLDKLRSQQNEEAADGEDNRGKKRLQFLLRQAEVFQHFAPDLANKKKKGKGRHGGTTEENEDAELLADETGDGEAAGHRLSVQPAIITGGKLREYQMQGLNWMIHLYDNGINGILADEMGLGKTLQTISLLAYLNEYRGITGPHMVIVPKSTLHNWLNEFRRWCPTIRAVKFHGNQEERAWQKDNLIAPGKFDAMVTSYEMVIKEKNHFKKFHWRYVIIDEAHRMKNENSMLSKVIRTFKTNYRMLITGTPLQNNLHELWALLNFLLPEVFASAERFDEWFALGSDNKEAEAEVVQQLHKVLRPFLLRRLKSDVEKGLPPKKETILKIGMSDMQKKYYAALLQKDIEAITDGADRSRLLNVVMQLRKCCNHPYLFQGAEPGPPFTTGEHLVENAGKMVLLDKLLPRLKEKGSRVLIFSQMTRMLDILEDYCLFRGHQYCRIDGNTSGEDREAGIDAYNAPNSEKFVFLLSTRAGGLGINLYTADIVVLYDSDWNPQMDLQAMDRAHRIGQKKEVHVYRFCTDHSIEEKVIEKAYKKLRLDALVIQQGRLTENTKTVNKEDLLNMVRYGAETIFAAETSSNITNEDIEALITKGEEETKKLNDKLKEFSENAMRFTMDGGVNLYDYKDEEKEEEKLDLKMIIGHNWVDPPKRERKRIVNYSETEFRGKAREGGARNQGPRLPKMPQLHDFQFYNTARLTQLYEQEAAYEAHKHQKEQAAKQAGATEEGLEAMMVPAPDDPQPLTEEETKERETLLTEGFGSWTKREFSAFVRGCERHGRTALPEIAKEVEGKTLDEVKEYAKVFWKRYTELRNHEKIINSIEAGEQKIQRQQDIMNAIASKMERYKNPWQELKITYGNTKGKAFTEDEDRFMICSIHKLGYGQWDELKAEIRNNWKFRFDWYIKSRTPQELQRRCTTLINAIQNELKDSDARDTDERKKGGAKKGGGSKVTDSSGGAGPVPTAAGKRKSLSAGASAGGEAKRAKKA